MKIVFLGDTAQDIQWFRYYYRSVFPEGIAKARTHLRAIQKALAANPYAGRPSDARDGVRELSISRTPFTLIYRVGPTQIEVLRFWDTRQGTGY
ncbi:type II toxin-antitoxin system RelE/ParE family toxin (plasmid) [Sulfitobacter sp. OXR-159]|uniref:type II toxin-antitoxin system RelE/ParE family toxin n=1 Tax=Sulfitobacter sp. OXR-159 TaxID=3100174 RepID=UPI002AC99F7A|nr:type II toxin-antitoxin system RelE/ParE family toxin [Sulfitobacter sp. OXR-159]WPZ31625.1 type II toxin-antitoxin system RelE/ParE family toxin [Sulfitobacter sp. OXR-159]